LILYLLLGKSGAAGAGDEDDLGGDLAVDDELVAASTVKPKRGEDDEEEDDEDESSAEEGEQDQGIQLGSFNEVQDFQDIFSDAFLAPTDDDVKAQETERAKVSKLMATFTPDQMERYEAFRRSRLAAPGVRKVMNSTLGFSVHHDCGIVMAGAAKLFVGEMIETARQVQDQWSKANGIQGPYGPLTPDCIREAYRRLKQDGKVPYAPPTRLFKR
jgi:transcription initiation factor TFIID subunit 11